MTIDELRERAGNGDVEAMLQLGYELMQQNDFKAAEEATKWDEAAAKAGNPNGIMMTISTLPLLATIYESAPVGSYVEALDCWQRIKYWSNQALEKINLTEEDFQSVKEGVADAEYGMCYCLYKMKNTNQALKGLNQTSSMRMQILKALCIFSEADTNQDYENAFKELCVVEKENTSMLCGGLLQDEEENILHKACLALAGLYRVGIKGKPENDKAVAVLKKIYQELTSEDYKSRLMNELNRYKPKMFGGYKYV